VSFGLFEPRIPFFHIWRRLSSSDSLTSFDAVRTQVSPIQRIQSDDSVAEIVRDAGKFLEP